MPKEVQSPSWLQASAIGDMSWNVQTLMNLGPKWASQSGSMVVFNKLEHLRGKSK